MINRQVAYSRKRNKPVDHLVALISMLMLKKRKINLDSLYPNFLIIGAQKCATTSLHNYLNYHPDLFMTFVKEDGLFLSKSDKRKISIYDDKKFLKKLMFFNYRNQKIIGSSPTFYSMAPDIGHDVPKRIYSVNPKMKFVYIVRNPFERIRSQYTHYVRDKKGKNVLKFDSYILNNMKTQKNCINRSCYYYQLMNYLDYFDISQFKIIAFEELIANTIKTTNEIISFVGLKVDDYKLNNFKTYNASKVIAKKSNIKFSRQCFDQFASKIKEDTINLETLIGRKFMWDLSNETWCL
jgi:hypothetical protein